MKAKTNYTAAINGNTALKIEQPKLRLVPANAPVQAPVPVSARNIAIERERAHLSDYIVAAAVCIACAAALIFALSQADIRAAEQLASYVAETPAVTVSVMPGDTLWMLAAEHPISGHSTPDVVSWIRARNQLEDSSLSVGQVIEVPNMS